MKVTVICRAIVEFAREFDIDVDTVNEFGDAVERFERHFDLHCNSIDDLNNIQCEWQQVHPYGRPRAYAFEFGTSVDFNTFIDLYLDRYAPIGAAKDTSDSTDSDNAQPSNDACDNELVDVYDEPTCRAEENCYWGQYSND